MSPWSFALLLAGCPAPEPEVAAVSYPETRRDPAAVDTYFGTEVADPYRWLEDPDAPETRSWIEAQNALTAQVLGDTPERAAIRDRLGALWRYERFELPEKTAGRYLYEHNDGTQDQDELLIAETLDGPPRVLLDANTFSSDGTVSLTSWFLSEDGKLLVYGTSDGGSDWNTLRVRDVATGVDLPDTIQWVKFSVPAWKRDGSGFWYARYPEPDPANKDAALANQKVYFHRIGTAQGEDQVVLETPEDPQWGFDFEPTEDGELLIASLWRGSEDKSRVWVKDLRGEGFGGAAGATTPPGEAGLSFGAPAAEPSPARWNGEWIKLLDAFDAMYRYVDRDGDRLLFWTDKDAPMGRLVAVRLDGAGALETVIPESTVMLEGVGSVGGQLFASYLRDAHSQVLRFDLQGKPLGEVPLPGLGTVRGFDGKRADQEVFFAYESFTTPEQILRYDLATGEVTPFRVPQVRFDPAPYVTEQVFFPSKDGTRIPMFLVRRSDAPRDGDRPVLLYGYGGFNISRTPEFEPWVAAWLELGGVYALVNLRGGGEYGREWHEAGTKLRKQNVFDDYIAAAEYLMTERWTQPSRIGIHGRSNGGLLVGATLVQRPDLFGAAVPMVGVLDLLKYHTWTIGWGWASDYGTSADSEEMFRALLAYSPVHNTKPASYPPTLILTGDHDDRVVPAHSFKFTAALQHAQQGPAPVLARIDTRAGHGSGKSVTMQIDERADMLWFLAKSLRMPVAIRGEPH